MASDDENLYPLPIYFSDDDQLLSPGNLANKRGSRPRGRGQRPGSGDPTRGRRRGGRGSSSARGLGAIRKNTYYTTDADVNRDDVKEVQKYDTDIGARQSSQRRYNNSVWCDESSDKEERTFHRGRQAARGRGYRGYRGRGKDRGDQQNHARNDTDAAEEKNNGRGGNNRWDTRKLKQSHSALHLDEGLEPESQRNDRNESRGRGQRRGTRRLKPCRSDVSLNLLGPGESQLTLAYHKRQQRPSKEQSIKNDILLGSDAACNDLVDGKKVSTRDSLKPREFHLGYKKLDEWSKMTEDPDDLVLQISNSRSGLVECLEKDLKPDWIHRILDILSIAVNTQTCTHNLRELLNIIEDLLMPKINELLSQILLESHTHRHMFIDKEKLCRLCILVITVLKYQMDVLPASLGKCFPIILLLKQIKSEHKLNNETLSAEIEELDLKKDLIKQEREILRKRTTRSSKGQSKINVESEPPESFRKLPILPSVEDLLLDDEPYLRSNIEEGKFKDLEQYLDIHFRLLREDYMRPLRDGIRDYKTGLTSGEFVKKVRDIRLYHNVQVLMPVCTLSGICHVLQFDTKPFQKINWNTSQRLLYGSLVCLSADDFNTIIFGTVTERDSKQLTNGQIQVLFESTDDAVEVKPNVTYVMAETTAYFEAYRHILSGLQEMKYTLPLQKYIIQCETELQQPKYLLNQRLPMYDFTCVLSKQAIRRGVAVFPALNTNKWPRETDLSFDSSQMEAMQMALTKEMVLIQGPPGTGKTYVGLKIAKVLLANKDHWIGEGKSSCPILVVCYTNHALDQFLEGIHTFCDANIVRVGGRSSNETLEPFLLKNIRKERRKEKSRSITLFRGEKDCIMHMKGSKYKIEKVSEKIKACTTKLISIDVHSVVSDRHSNSLQRRISYKCRDNSLAIWLGFTTEEEEAHQEDLENLPAKEKLTNIWKEMIINDVSPMTDDDVRCVKDVHALDLHERARLYKAWISQYMQQLEQELRNPFKDDIGSRTTRQKVMKRMKKEVLGLDSLTHFHLPPPYQHQIMQIGDMSLRNTKTDLVNSWLCLDFLPQSIALIRNIIENPPLELEDKDVDDDLEENRKLDDDDTDDFLQEYKTHGAEHIKSRESDWTRVVSNRKLEQKVRKLLNKPPKITDDDVSLIDDVWEIPMETRKDLYRYWVRKYRTILKQEISQHEQEYQNAVMKYKEVLDLDSLDIMRTATVIGMTTTGAAKNRTLLQKVRPKIIIVEEAAEVLESHIVTTLNENCQHLILIGDHKQLRPNPTVYDLAKRYKLDISLFERLIKNKVPCVTLSEQHRMRPEISVLMRHKNLYPNLRDHHSVRLLADVLGVGGNVCFIDHKELEEQSGESTSYFNSYEAEFLASFCKYLIMQGYEAEQITVLSPYMGQVIKLRKTMPKHDFDGVRITAVDNYQGEENDIILLSLVRSDVKDEYFKKKNPIGFLGIENRVCVALSRAKKGLFVIGNFEHLASYSDMWQYMVSTMRESNNIKKSITLRCQNHPDSAFEASTPEDFKKAPEGGCKLSCNFPLQCGHICQRFCHVRDKDHKFYKCFKPCGRTNACGHKCQRKCCQDCLPCLSKTEKTIPYCGHKSTMKCHLDPAKCVCLETCVRKLPCGHTCGLKCGDCRSNNKHRQRCEVKVEKRWPCGHTGITDCYMASKDNPCPQPCKEQLRCNHTCSGTCGECLEGRIHKSCKETCNKLLLCGHRCSFPCSEVCPPCTRRCEWICSHNIRCPNKCSQECWKCVENCTLKCPHVKCTRMCFEECGNVTCNEPCKKELSCGHPCTGLCGEICPRICPVCEPKQLVNPDDRMIFLQDCQCNISVARLDYHMEQTVQATNGKVVPVYRCPECNKPIIKTIKRYTNYMKERRQLIADRYLALLGTPIQRKQESSRLRIRIQNLERLGLSLRDARTLEELELNTVEKEFGGLHNIKRKTEIIEDILKLMQEAKTVKGQNETYVLAQVNKIKDLIMIKRKYVTSQFWDEAQKEIKTLRQSLHGTDVIKPCHSVSKSATASRVESNILETSVTQLYKELQNLSPAALHKNVDGINISNDGGKKINKITRDAVENDKASDEIVDASDEILD